MPLGLKDGADHPVLDRIGVPFVRARPVVTAFEDEEDGPDETGEEGRMGAVVTIALCIQRK